MPTPAKQPKPLDEFDALLLQYRGVSVKVARQVARRHHGFEFEDVEAACWSGVAYGLRTHDAARGELLPYLFLCARHHARRYILRESRRGVSGVPRGVPVCVVPLADGVANWLPGREECVEVWEERDWRKLLSRLSRRDARAVEMRFREGRGYDEVARELGVSDRAARGIVSAAVAELRMWLAGEREREAA